MEDLSKSVVSEGELGYTSKEKPNNQEPRSKWGWLFLFVVGFLIGVSVKAQAAKTITMGFDDYKLENLRSDFKLMAKKENSDESAETGTEADQAAGEDQQSQEDAQPVEENADGGNANNQQ